MEKEDTEEAEVQALDEPDDDWRDPLPGEIEQLMEEEKMLEEVPLPGVPKEEAARRMAARRMAYGLGQNWQHRGAAKIQ